MMMMMMTSMVNAFLRYAPTIFTTSMYLQSDKNPGQGYMMRLLRVDWRKSGEVIARKRCQSISAELRESLNTEI